MKPKCSFMKATLVAAAHLLYRFVELESLKNFAQAFIDLGAAYGCVPASDFIAGRLMIQKDIVNELLKETIADQCGFVCYGPLVR